jgi:hypothetical protein
MALNKCTCIGVLKHNPEGPGFLWEVSLYDPECPNAMHAITAELDFHPNWQ